MNESLRTKMAQVKEKLDADPAGVIAGEFRPSTTSVATGIACWDQFLAVTNGGRFGSIDIWSTDEIDQNQFYTSQMPGGSSAWLVVGQVLYEPLAVSRKTHEIVLHPQNGSPKNLGEIDQFLMHNVFGEGYADIVPDVEQEEWWQVIHKK